MNGSAGVPTLLVDDHPVVRTGLVAFLRDHAGVRVIAEAGSLREMRTVLDRLAPDEPAAGPGRGERPERERPELAIVDLRLPDGSGIDAIRELRARLPEARIVVLSSFPEEDAIRRALRAGAHGWLDKQQDPRALADAVRAALRGERPLADEAVVALATPEAHDPTETLTARELEVLRRIGSGASNREIAERLGIREATVKAHAGSIYAKLGVERRAQAIRIAQRRWPDDVAT